MKTDWHQCSNILCIRADNMGDLLMSSPAMRALKETFGCRITVLTSSMAAGIAKHLPEIDETITYDLPWVKTGAVVENDSLYKVVDDIKSRNFDAAVIFTVYSQNPLPAVMLAYLAGIPKRLAYCRENPYELLTNWVPDKEPYTFIRHQVKRDLELVASIGALTLTEKISLRLPSVSWHALRKKLNQAGIDIHEPWLIVHAGVSEQKREYPEDLWVQTGRKLIEDTGHQLLLTGTEAEKAITHKLEKQIGKGAFSVAGLLSLEEFIVLIHHAPLVISVNTGTVHIAAAVSTPVIVLYALTNPQHLPWKVAGKVLPFDIPKHVRSKNEVVKHVHNLMDETATMISPEEIVNAATTLLNSMGRDEEIAEMVSLKTVPVY